MSPLPSDPPPRLGPRPLPLHLGVEAWTTQLSFAALTLSSAGLRRSNPELPDLLQRALAESQADPHAVVDPVRLVEAVAAAAKARMEAFGQGVARYQSAPPPERPPVPPSIWSKGAASLHAYGGATTPVLVVPSLVNRSTILDLAPDRSFLRDLADAGLAAYLLDWGAPGDAERAYDTGAYITEVLIPALRVVSARHQAPVHLIGYCMGGTLSVAPAVLAPDLVAGLVLLAAPWDFHADNTGPRAMLAMLRPLLEIVIAAHDGAPIDLLQTFFAALDPALVGRKFRAFAALDPASEEARRFVALEDWLNDGVRLTAPVARECLFAWYGANTPHLKQWFVRGTVIDPARVAAPALVMIPAQDRIVPPRAAGALGEALPRAHVETVPLGHIGMIAGGEGRRRVTEPIVQWIQGAN